MNVEILIFDFFAECQINDDVMAPSDVTSFSIACSHSTNCNSLFDQSASTDSLNDFVFRREFVWQCFCYTQVSDRCDIFWCRTNKTFWHIRHCKLSEGRSTKILQDMTNESMLYVFDSDHIYERSLSWSPKPPP